MNWTKITLFTLLTCWYLYQPVPDGFSSPWKLRAVCAVQKTLLDILDVAERLGIGTLHGSLGSISRYMEGGTQDDRIQNMVFDGVPVRVYNVHHRDDTKKPGLVYYHGSGWIADNIKMYDSFLLSLLDTIDIIIISVDYRLAGGDVKFPVPLDDCVTATRYFMEHTDQFNVDPGRIAIGGDSAGGNLAAATSLRLRDYNSHIMPKLQLLINPPLQAIDFSLPSYVQNAEGPFLTRYYAARCWSVYATGSASLASVVANNKHTSPDMKRLMSQTHIRHDDLDISYHYAPYLKPRLNIGDEAIWNEVKPVLSNPYYAPLLAEDLAGVPNTYMYTSQADVFRDEGILYVNKLRNAGVAVTHINDKHGVHGSCTLDTPDNELCVREAFTFIKNNL